MKPDAHTQPEYFRLCIANVYQKHKQAGIIRSRSSNSELDILASTESNHTENFEQFLDQLTSTNGSFSETSQAEIDHLLGPDQEKQKRASALFLLKLKEFKQVVIDEIVGEWDTVFSHDPLNSSRCPSILGCCRN